MRTSRLALLLACVALPAAAACVGSANNAAPPGADAGNPLVPPSDAGGARDGTVPPSDAGSPSLDGASSPDGDAHVPDANVSINEWTWMAGSNATGAAGTYGTLGDGGAGDTPGSRYGATSWTDPGGHLWLFGGTPVDGIPMLNDLWKFDGASWAWMGGSNVNNAVGVYVAKDAGAGTAFPGARYFTSSTTDSHGKLWLFGGKGFGASSTEGMLSDLWTFDGAQWTWVTGDTSVNVAPAYLPDAGPVAPGGRNRGLCWVDNAGNFWLFGGRNPAGTVMNDLWKFDGASWTWVTGSGAPNASGVYGTRGTGAAGNTPGAREDSVAWTDAAGAMWLYGGWGYDSAGLLSDLGDLWKFDGTQWTWIFGSNVGNGAATYGTPRMPAASNDPGGRENAAAGKDPSGHFWMVSGTSSHDSGEHNDLWLWDGAAWTWVAGGNGINSTGTYGSPGVAGAANVLGGRDSASAWSDPAGNVWVFGGWGFGASGTDKDLNDLWRYQP